MRYLIFFGFALLFNFSFAQSMNNNKLNKIFQNFADSIVSQDGYWQMFKNDNVIISISDKKNNRMRIIMPIAMVEDLKINQMQEALEANFHSVLDVKYAISDDVIWSIFVHPLKELSPGQVEDALSQVYFAALTFGKSYSSTNLIFPKNEDE